MHCSDMHTFYFIMNNTIGRDCNSKSNLLNNYPTCFTLFSMMPRHSSISDSVMVKGGANRMILPWVGFASSPFSFI